MIRTKTYKNYKSFKDLEEKPGKLLKQQVFLSSYIKDNYDKLDKMLIYHGIGTGKTCTSITIAETIMTINKNMKVLVILPARLKTNFIDELLSDTCGLNKYVSKEDYKLFIDPNVSLEIKNTIRLNFTKRIEEKYEIISYEKFRSLLIKSLDYKKEIKKLTKNRIIIIDEVHNLIASKISDELIKKILGSRKIEVENEAINALILRLLTILIEPSAKLFLLTATPVFDNYGQFIQLILNLRPDVKITEKNMYNLEYLINLIKGKVSFYKLKDKSAFPTKQINNIEIPISTKQRELIKKLKETGFCIKERQILISVYDKSKKSLVFSNLDMYAPKLKKLFELLKLPGKHVVYSNFIKYCLELIAEYLDANGWSNYIKTGVKTNKTYVLWNAELKDKEKQEIKLILNSKDNIDGKVIKVVLGSPSIKEGVSFKHVQHLHQIDPVWNTSAKNQIEGRVIRYKSHEDINLDDPILKRKVIVHNYIGTGETCDEKIYYDIMLKKEELINELEKLLKKVAFDYYLWQSNKSPKSHSKSSMISAKSANEKLNDILKIKNIKKKNKNSCPNSRRPDENNKCSIKYPYLYNNKNGDTCCFSRPSCPDIRKPINNRCLNKKYKYLYKNMYGDDCCFNKLKS
jgi:hypothetical protein